MIDTGTRFGFGLAEDTALYVPPDGPLEVIGSGGVTVVDVSHAKLRDGLHGATVSGVVLHHLTSGDTMDHRTGVIVVNPSKARIAAGAESNLGSRLVPDLGQTDSLKRALTEGLVDSRSERQVGLLLRFHRTYGHGYQFTFRKASDTRGYLGRINDQPSYTVTGVALDIRPVTLILDDAEPRAGAVGDSARKETQAALFRGILPNGSLAPGLPLTRASSPPRWCGR